MGKFLVIAGGLLLLGGCSRDFDSEYKDTQQEIAEKSNQLDDQLEKQMEAEIGSEAQNGKGSVRPNK